MDEPQKNIPWVEKYRPIEFDHIVLDELNHTILKNIIHTSYFTNLLFYGPPGTGKTTTIMNLIRMYQEKHGQQSKGMVIHLNASDERGIDIIRNQIHNFVNTKALFQSGLKFVILDEVDYMTKNAQQALRFLLQTYQTNVRFCLICNYISKIDESLQNDFIKLRFNQLPREKIIAYLSKISEKEHLDLSYETICSIQKMYKSDIRSMINFMQTNQELDDFQLKIVDDQLWKTLDHYMLQVGRYTPKEIIQKICEITVTHNIDKKHIIKNYLNHLFRNHMDKIDSAFLSYIEQIIHIPDCNIDIYMNYIIQKIQGIVSTASPSGVEPPFLKN